MGDQEQPEAAPTLASLRRKRSRQPRFTAQPSLFSPPADLADASTPELRHLSDFKTSGTPEATTALPLAAAAPPQPEPAQRIPDLPAPVIATPHQEAGEVIPAAVAPRRETWTVSGLVQHVRGLVERGYGQVTVEGEVSNWRPAGSGHCYFTLKDTGAQLSAVLFRRQAALLRFQPADGDAVRIHGQLSIYESRGQMQLIVEWMEQVGFGALLAAVQRLKEKLRREGLFDRKRPLPPFPRCIGVITSLQGAALRDIVKVCRRRHASVHLLIYPAAVQGPNCAAEIAAGLRWFNAHTDHAEVVLVARGGGSWEDLHGFDDERIARAIAASRLPVITGIGHATDSTIADAAADVCAPTPSAAAELLTAAHHQVEERIFRLHGRLCRAGAFELLRARQRLARLNAGNVLRQAEDGLNRRAQRVDELQFRAEASLRARHARHVMRVSALCARLDRQNPAVRLGEARRHLEALRLRLTHMVSQRTADRAGGLDRCLTRLEALNPLRVLERGYALVYGPDGHLLRSALAAREGQEITARLAQGSLRARVVHLSPQQ